MSQCVQGARVFDCFGTVVTGSGSHPMWVMEIDNKFFARTECTLSH